MIAASEPLEFIPRGRQAVEEHPGPLFSKQEVSVPNEIVLLHRMQNVNISSDDDICEFWSMREIFEEVPNQENYWDSQNIGNKFGETTLSEFYVNSEEELYVKGTTAVWTKGLLTKNTLEDVAPSICCSCDSNIRHAFFCNENFFTAGTKDNLKKNAELNGRTKAICLIDSTSLRVYCDNGEDYLANLNFPISNVWSTKYGLLLETEPSRTTIEMQSISMPRFFTLVHPLDEMCPLLHKSVNGNINYLTESDYRIIFSTYDNDLILLYDNKIGKHLVAKLRKATKEEIQVVSCSSDSNNSTWSFYNRGGAYNNTTSQNSSFKLSGFLKQNSSMTARSGISIGINSPFIKKMHTTESQQAVGTSISNTLYNHSNTNSPHSRPQSSIGINSSIQDIRKIGQAQPAKPIVPEFILEHIWTENVAGKEFCESASMAFFHTDLTEQIYLCYMLSRTCKLHLIRLEKTSSPKTKIFGIISTITAKDAVVLNRMKMIAILDQTGNLVLYTGPVLVAKVHITGLIASITTSQTLKHSFSTFPRRSSLLPTIQQTSEAHFDDELHLLSPVRPLESPYSNRNGNSCINLRDAVGNRLTLVYPGGKMYRVCLPLIYENPFIKRCISTLRQILTKDLQIQLIVKWYCARNAPGSQDFSAEQEWTTFKNILYDLLGRSTSSNELNLSSDEPKKRRLTETSAGTNSDWAHLVDFLEKASSVQRPSESILHSDSSAPLFLYIPIIFYALHLLYEDMKLDSLMTSYLKYLSELLYQLASDMQLGLYCLHYFKDFPDLVNLRTENYFTEEDGKKMNYIHLLKEPVPNIYSQILNIIKGRELVKYPYIANVNATSGNIIKLISLICHGSESNKIWIQKLKVAGHASIVRADLLKFKMESTTCMEKIVQMLLEMNMCRSDIERLPSAIHYIIGQSLEKARLTPPIGCPPQAYELLLRPELVAHAIYKKSWKNRLDLGAHVNRENSLSLRVIPSTDILQKNDSSVTQEDGMENIDTTLLRLRYLKDLRILEVRRLLNSSEHMLIDVTQSPGVSDHDFIEEQEKQLYAMCIRTMALPMGRGMFTLRTSTPPPTESMPIPKLCLTGKEPVKGATIEMQQIEFPAYMQLWPTFHNGVAAGLRIPPNADNINSTWIVYNRPKGQAEIPTEHAGFLMALGLNGHLKVLSFMSVYEYLVKCDEMTSIGLLLGISATYRGTMHTTVTRLLSVHLEALLPATAIELDIPQNTQVAALMGIGLLYQGTAKRHIAEVLLQEIGRPPGPEMENSVERESYALTAGLALGLVTLGQGESPAGLRDLQLTDTLHYYMVGGSKRPLTGSQKEKYKLPSFQVREGDTVNIDVTAPGATLALGLMFFNTGNQAVAQWMKPPDTSYLLDLIRPDMLLLRIIARGLILWDQIEPTMEWLLGQFPTALQFDLERGRDDNSTDIDHEANCQAFCNIISGAAFTIGLRYAGTGNSVAFNTLFKTIQKFLYMNGQYVGEYAGKATVESSIILILISISLVIAGSGSLKVLRLIRFLRSRIGSSNLHVSYGSHMGIHMALGFLFLGCGRYTLSRSPESIAALVCALFPKFPIHSYDNRYHLQAFRHLYVLAVEPRLFLPRDIDTGKLCLCKISYVELGSKELKSLPMAPCMLPELSTLQSVIVDDTNYWSVCFERGRNWDQLVKVLENCDCIDIKKRAGCLSVLEDPYRLKSLLAQTLTSEQYSCWKIDPNSLLSFSNDAKVIRFTEVFLSSADSNNTTTPNERKRLQYLLIIFYMCLTKDKMHALSIYLQLCNALENHETISSSTDIWQFKIIDAYMNYNADEGFISKEIFKSLNQQLHTKVECWRDCFSPFLKLFLSSTDLSIFQSMKNRAELCTIAAMISYYNLLPNSINIFEMKTDINFLQLLFELRQQQVETDTINCISKILGISN